MSDRLLEVRDLCKEFPARGRKHEPVRAVDGVSFDVGHGQTFALVGRSGSGKSTTARMVLRLLAPTSGTVKLGGQDVHALGGHELRRFRTSVQAVFQDPWSSLSPRLRIGSIVAEPLVVNTRPSRAERARLVAGLLEEVGLDPRVASRFPHELSGGMRQRAALARALALKPALIVLVEPVSALDVSIRAQIMNLLRDLQQDRGMAYLVIAHDLATVRYLSHEVAVMLDGRIVERGTTEAVFDDPQHEYTRSLLAAALTALGEPPPEAVRAHG